jgi:type IV pilus assembly protein PilW
MQNNKFQLGMNLIELMVALVIGLLLMLVIVSVMSVSEGRKRTTTSVNDIDKAGAFALYKLDESLCSAGSGLAAGLNLGVNAASFTFGCKITAARDGITILPAPTTLPAPFNTLPAPLNTTPINFPLVPAIIMEGAAGNGGDVLMVMSGSSGLSASATSFSAEPTASSLNLTNVAAFSANDMALIASPPTETMQPCMISQVSANFTPAAEAASLPLSGQYYQSVIGNQALSNFKITSVALSLGNQPTFNLLAVGANNTLFQYNLLTPPADNKANNPNPSQLVDGVYQMKALYGVYTTEGDPSTLTWVAPTGNYSAANLLAGNAAALASLSNIKAIKVGLVMQSNLPEKETVSANTLTLFESTSTPVTVKLTALNYRYRAFEATVPLRNALLLLKGE